MCRVIYLGQSIDCDNCKFPTFLYAFTTGLDPRADTFTSFTDQSFALIRAEVSLQISSSSLKPSNLVGMICASFTVSAAGKSIQSTLLARKIIMITQRALSWSTVAILFFFQWATTQSCSHLPQQCFSMQLSVYVG